MFIDASAQFVRQGTNNTLLLPNQQTILDAYAARKDVPYFAALVDHSTIKDNEYKLTVSSYVEVVDTREHVDIVKLNADIAGIAARQTKLRKEIDKIVAGLESGQS